MKILWKYWLQTFLVSLLLLVLFGWWHGQFTNLFMINRIFSDVGFLLIAASFALSGLSYFFLKKKHLIYRRYLGIIGFIFVLFHGVLSFILFPLSYYFSNGLVFTSFFTGLIGLLFFAFLAAISLEYYMSRLKSNWRKILRWGYVAFVLSIIHIVVLYWDAWSYWFTHMNTFLPPSLPVTVVGIIVVLLRIVLYIKIKK